MASSMSARETLWAVTQRIVELEKPLKVPAQASSSAMKAVSLITKPFAALANVGNIAKAEDFQAARVAAGRVVDEATRASPVHDRSAGALVGMALGDSVGAPLEFIPATSKPVSNARSHLAPVPVEDDRQAATSTPRWWLDYYDPLNKFELLQGQWTDDTSMGLCLADSLLAQRGAVYNGSDCRVRYWLWWSSGYNNAFRFDRRQGLTSVGLGGNIASSLYQLENRYAGRPAAEVPAIYESNGDEAGNGSIMRLAPVPIRWAHDPLTAARVAVESSLATHPGADAAAACAFLGYAVARLIRRPSEKNESGVTAPAVSVLDGIVSDFLREADDLAKDATAIVPALPKLRALLESNPPSNKEACWDWRRRDTTIAIDETLAARGHSYNGHPNSAGYFGSYSLDALAIALWSVHGSNSFGDAILRCVNLLGDSDSTGAVAGQLAGAFYGYQAIADPTDADRKAAAVSQLHGSNEPEGQKQQPPRPTFGRVALDNLFRHDKLMEIPLRALMLAEYSTRHTPDSDAPANANN